MQFQKHKGYILSSKNFSSLSNTIWKRAKRQAEMQSGRQWGSGLPMLTALDCSTDWGIEPSCWAQVLIEAFALGWASTIIVLKKSIRNRDFVCVLKHKIQSPFKVQRTLFYYFKNILTPPPFLCCLSVWGAYKFLWCGHLSIRSQKAISGVSTYLSSLLETRSPCCSLLCMLE